MQQYCTSGSVEGVMGDHDSYSDIFGFRICFGGVFARSIFQLCALRLSV